MQSEKKAFTVAQWCDAYSISRTTFYSLQRKGRGPALMYIGAKTLITVEADEAWRTGMQRTTMNSRARRPTA